MNNGWVDIKNTDMMLIMGGNPAENHPCGYKWPIDAKRTRNAKTIVVDPRFTRTAATADLFCQIRAGTDIAFRGGIIRYTIENNRIAKEYLVNYTNAAFIVRDDFKLPDVDGLFSGFDAQKKTYSRATWNYAGSGVAGGKDAAQGSTLGGAAHPPSGGAPPPPYLPEQVEFDLSIIRGDVSEKFAKRYHPGWYQEVVRSSEARK